MYRRFGKGNPWGLPPFSGIANNERKRILSKKGVDTVL
jgi:hypothetical protein